MLDAPEVLGSIQRIRAVLTIAGALHCYGDAPNGPEERLEGLIRTLADVNEELREVEMTLVRHEI